MRRETTVRIIAKWKKEKESSLASWRSWKCMQKTYTHEQSIGTKVAEDIEAPKKKNWFDIIFHTNSRSRSLDLAVKDRPKKPVEFLHFTFQYHRLARPAPRGADYFEFLRLDFLLIKRDLNAYKTEKKSSTLNCNPRWNFRLEFVFIDFFIFSHF